MSTSRIEEQGNIMRTEKGKRIEAAFREGIEAAKEHVIHFVEDLPEDLSVEVFENKIIEEVRYRRHVRKVVEKSLLDIAEGRTYSNAEAAKLLGIDL